VTTYIVRRLAQSVVVIFGVTLIVFLLVHMLPGGPAKAMLGPTATLQQVHYFTVENGWNQPVLVQYAHYIGRLLQGNLGFSYTYNQSVASLLADDIPKTALLIGLAYLCTMIIAVPIGILQAVRSNSTVDHAITGGAFVAYSMPTFWLSTLLILWFSVSIHLFLS
jgi:peptide/nickel transport system permease protein